jgi:hypothetical protein
MKGGTMKEVKVSYKCFINNNSSNEVQFIFINDNSLLKSGFAGCNSKAKLEEAAECLYEGLGKDEARELVEILLNKINS